MFKIKFSITEKDKIKQVLGIEEEPPYEIVLCKCKEDMEEDKINLVFDMEHLDEVATKIQFFTQVKKVYLDGKSKEGDIRIAIEDILYIESYGNDIYAYTMKESALLPLKLYQLTEQLEPFGLIRIGKSCIVNVAQIYAVKPHLNGKLTITMTNKKVIEVNRTYVSAFKNYIKK